MWSILERVNRRAKRTKIWDSGYYSYICRVLLMPDSLSLVWGHTVHLICKIFDVKIFKRIYCSASFHSISTKFYCKYFGHEGIQALTVFGDLPKFKNFMPL